MTRSPRLEVSAKHHHMVARAAKKEKTTLKAIVEKALDKYFR